MNTFAVSLENIKYDDMRLFNPGNKFPKRVLGYYKSYLTRKSDGYVHEICTFIHDVLIVNKTLSEDGKYLIIDINLEKSSVPSIEYKSISFKADIHMYGDRQIPEIKMYVRDQYYPRVEAVL